MGQLLQLSVELLGGSMEDGKGAWVGSRKDEDLFFWWMRGYRKWPGAVAGCAGSQAETAGLEG